MELVEVLGHVLFLLQGLTGYVAHLPHQLEEGTEETFSGTSAVLSFVGHGVFRHDSHLLHGACTIARKHVAHERYLANEVHVLSLLFQLGKRIAFGFLSPVYAAGVVQPLHADRHLVNVFRHFQQETVQTLVGDELCILTAALVLVHPLVGHSLIVQLLTCGIFRILLDSEKRRLHRMVIGVNNRLPVDMERQVHVVHRLNAVGRHLHGAVAEEEIIEILPPRHEVQVYFLDSGHGVASDFLLGTDGVAQFLGVIL